MLKINIYKGGHKNYFQITAPIWTYFDLITWRFMFFPVHSCLKAPMTANHVLIKLLRHVEIRHTYQITAMLEN